MPYFNTITGEYPRHIGDLELLGWSVGDPLPEGWVEFEYDEAPALPAGKSYSYLPPVEDSDGSWRSHFSISDLSQEELDQQKLGHIRFKVARKIPISPEEALLLTEGYTESA